MAVQLQDERDARMLLAALCEPSDVITGSLIARLGAFETLQLIQSDGALPSGVDLVEGTLWRHRVASHVGPGTLERIQTDMQRHDLLLLTPDDLDWPGELQDLGARSPIALWLRGDSTKLSGPIRTRVAIVGARAASTYGAEATSEIASRLVAQGRVVVSGGAYGIDRTAHDAAISAAPGATIAVLASGLDRMYPSGNQEVFDRITTSGGLILSELPPGATPTRWRFLQRNRMLAALSGATVVVEAGQRSGALNIAGQAHSLGRRVGAVPGPTTSPTSAGCHRLIQDGLASLVVDAADVIDLLDTPSAPTRELALAHSPSRSSAHTRHDLRL